MRRQRRLAAHEATVCSVLGTLGWLPALHGLEHFLKRRAESLSHVALVGGTLGVMSIVRAAARC